MAGKLSENIAIDDDADCIEAYGQKISGELLRSMTEASPPGVWFRIEKGEGGELLVQQRTLT